MNSQDSYNHGECGDKGDNINNGRDNTTSSPPSKERKEDELDMSEHEFSKHQHAIDKGMERKSPSLHG